MVASASGKLAAAAAAASVPSGKPGAGGASSRKAAAPPFPSHEWVIQNHGDIMSCVLMLVIVGLMFQLTSAISFIFVAPQYNETVTVRSERGDELHQFYRTGTRDVLTVSFYVVVWIVVHAVIQEYVLDKLQRKFHLSKTKMSKFSESGQLLAFSAYAAAHAFYVLTNDVIRVWSELPNIWVGYPEAHRWLSLNAKLFFLLQAAYWIHQFPEFYFARVKRDEWRARTTYSLLFLGFTVAAYVTNFTRVALALLLLEYAQLVVFHAARIAHFMERRHAARQLFKVWNVGFVAVRLASTVLAIITFWYGLRQNEAPFVDVEAGNFNTNTVRLNALISVIVLQVYQLWNFVLFHMSRFRESSKRRQTREQSAAAVQQAKKAAAAKKEKKHE